MFDYWFILFTCSKYVQNFYLFLNQFCSLYFAKNFFISSWLSNFFWTRVQKTQYFLVVWSQSHVQHFAVPWTVAWQAPLYYISPRRCSNSCPLNWWCYLTISFSATPYSFYLQSFPAWGSFPVSPLFISGGQNIGVSALVSGCPMNIQGWLPLELTGLLSLQSKGLWRVFSSTIWKHQFFSAQLSLWPNSHIHTWLLEKP